MIKILVVQFVDASNTVFRRNNAVEDFKSRLQLLLGFLFLVHLIQDVSLLVVSSGSFRLVIGVKVEDLEGLVKQRAAKISGCQSRIWMVELTAR